MAGSNFKGRVGLQQRVLPAYRALFFDHLASRCEGGLGIFAGFARPSEMIQSAEELEHARWVRAQNLHLLSGSAYLCLQWGLLRWLSAWDPQVLILEANPRYLFSPLAARWMHNRGRVVIGWGLGAPPLRGRFAALRRWNRRRFLQHLDALIAYSSLGAEQYAAAGIPRDRIHVAVNAASPRPKVLPARPAIGDRPLRLIFVGRLQARKRLDVLLEACRQLESSPELWIVGAGPAEASLKSLAADRYPQAVFWGAKHGADLTRLLEQADVFVLPGSGGLAVQQAMAHGLPVIVAEGDGTQGDLVTPENGWLIPPGQLHALLDALRQAESQRGQLRKMGLSSHHLVLTKANIETMADVFIDVMQSGTTAGE